jgi:hypothetical protein
LPLPVIFYRSAPGDVPLVFDNMPLLNRKKFSRLISLPLLIVFLSVGFTSWKHSLSGGENRWMSRTHEARCIGYQAERLNLRSAVNAENDARASNIPSLALGTVIAFDPPISSGPLPSGCQSAVEVEESFLTRSPILNL